MTMKRVRLELARDHDFPNGSREHGYEFAAPLDEDGRLLLDDWRKSSTRCRVKRFWPGEKDEIGLLVNRKGGWAFDYNPEDTEDDEPGFKFESHRIVPGEYISIREHGGTMRTFRIVWVRDLD